MNFWQSISIRTKVYMAFVCARFVTIGLGAFAILQLSGVNEAAAASSQVVGSASELSQQAENLRGEVEHFLIALWAA